MAAVNEAWADWALGLIGWALYNRSRMDWPWTLAVPVGVAAGSSLATAGKLRWLERRAILDIPNQRSSHSVPTPRGRGIGVMLAILPALLGYAGLSPPQPSRPALPAP